MTTQINLRLQEDFLKKAKHYAKKQGFLNVQEFFREAAREKLYEDKDIKESYRQTLHSSEAKTFNSREDSKQYLANLKNKADRK